MNKNTGELDPILASALDPVNDGFIVWDNDASGIDRTKRMIPSELVNFVIGTTENSVKETITQAHSFVAGDVLYNNAGTWEKAQADADATAESLGIVESVGAGEFVIVYTGRIDGLSGLSTGLYFLSDTVAGDITQTEPSADTTISKPVLLATSATSGVVVNMRGFINSTAGGGAGVDSLNTLDGALTLNSANSAIGISESDPNITLTFEPSNVLTSTLSNDAGWTDDQTDAEIETAYNAQVDQVSGGEITAGTEIAIRRYSPADIASFVSQHESIHAASDVTNDSTVTGATVKDALDLVQDTVVPLIIETHRTASTGHVEGCALSINGGDATQIDIAAGSGLVVDAYTNPLNPTYDDAVFAGVTGLSITNIATQDVTYLGISALSGSTVVQQSTEFTKEQRRDFWWTGVAYHTNRSTVTTVIPSPNPVGGNGNSIFDLYDSIGPITEGAVLSSNGANLKIDRSAGTKVVKGGNFYANGKNPNEVTIAAETPSQFIYHYRDGSGGFKSDASTEDLIPNMLDDGSGTTTTYGNTNYGIQRWYVLEDGTNVVVPPQTSHGSFSAAMDAVRTESPVLDPILRPSDLRGFIIMRGNNTDFSNPDRSAILNTSRFGDLGIGAAGAGAANVTLAGAYDYLTIAGQEITLNQIDLATDVTGELPTANIADDAITYAKIQNVVADNRILGNIGGAGAVVAELTDAQVRTMINVEDGANNYVHPAHTGDVTGSSALTIANKTGDAAGICTGVSPDLANLARWNSAGNIVDSGINYNNVVQTSTTTLDYEQIPAASMTPRTTDGATPNKYEGGTNNTNIDVLSFSNGSVQWADCEWASPPNWDGGTIKIRFNWTGLAGSGTVEWRAHATAKSQGESWDQAISSPVVISSTMSGANQEELSLSPALTVQNSPAGGKLVALNISRNVDGTDSLGVDAQLKNIQIEYTKTIIETGGF